MSLALHNSVPRLNACRGTLDLHELLAASASALVMMMVEVAAQPGTDLAPLAHLVATCFETHAASIRKIYGHEELPVTDQASTS